MRPYQLQKKCLRYVTPITEPIAPPLPFLGKSHSLIAHEYFTHFQRQRDHAVPESMQGNKLPSTTSDVRKNQGEKDQTSRPLQKETVRFTGYEIKGFHSNLDLPPDAIHQPQRDKQA